MHGKSMVKKVPLMTEAWSSMPESISLSQIKLRFPWYFSSRFLFVRVFFRLLKLDFLTQFKIDSSMHILSSSFSNGI